MKRLKCFGLTMTLAVAAAGLSVTVWAQVSPSAPNPPVLTNRQVDLSTLESALQAQDWEAADNETRRILQSFVHADNDLFAEPVPTLIPPEVLQAIESTCCICRAIALAATCRRCSIG